MTILIDQAFVSKLLNSFLEIDLVHENGMHTDWNGSEYTSKIGVYSPDPREGYAEIKHFPAGKKPFSTTSDEAVGLFQVILKYPTDIGTFAIKDKAEEILSVLKIGSTLSFGNQNVEIVSNARDGGRIDGSYYQIVVRANYRAFTPR